MTIFRSIFGGILSDVLKFVANYFIYNILKLIIISKILKNVIPVAPSKQLNHCACVFVCTVQGSIKMQTPNKQ